MAIPLVREADQTDQEDSQISSIRALPQDLSRGGSLCSLWSLWLESLFFHHNLFFRKDFNGFGCKHSVNPWGGNRIEKLLWAAAGPVPVEPTTGKLEPVESKKSAAPAFPQGGAPLWGRAGAARRECDEVVERSGATALNRQSRPWNARSVSAGCCVSTIAARRRSIHPLLVDSKRRSARASHAASTSRPIRPLTKSITAWSTINSQIDPVSK